MLMISNNNMIAEMTVFIPRFLTLVISFIFKYKNYYDTNCKRYCIANYTWQVPIKQIPIKHVTNRIYFSILLPYYLVYIFPVLGIFTSNLALGCFVVR